MKSQERSAPTCLKLYSINLTIVDHVTALFISSLDLFKIALKVDFYVLIILQMYVTWLKKNHVYVLCVGKRERSSHLFFK